MANVESTAQGVVIACTREPNPMKYGLAGSMFAVCIVPAASLPSVGSHTLELEVLPNTLPSPPSELR